MSRPAIDVLALEAGFLAAPWAPVCFAEVFGDAPFEVFGDAPFEVFGDAPFGACSWSLTSTVPRPPRPRARACSRR
jgi:hypothetical protein